MLIKETVATEVGFARQHLLSNAFKYTPAGGEVQFVVDDADNQLIFTIRDSGQGIPADNISKLFQPFYRASNVGQVPGTGLGLSIARNFIELHASSIDVTSIEGDGTTFTVKLPI